MKTLAQFQCFGESVQLLASEDETAFTVQAQWSAREGDQQIPRHRLEQGCTLRRARIVFEEQVQLALCRLTLGAMYAGLGQPQPQGNGKYAIVD